MKRKKFTYQGDLLITEEQYESPDGVNWENYMKKAFEYYPNGKVKTYVLSHGRINNQWVPAQKVTFVYTGDLRKEEALFLWDSTASDWAAHPSSGKNYLYNDQNLCDTVIQATIASNGTATFPYMHVATYNSSGQMTSYTNFSWENRTNVFIPYFRSTLTYNYTYLSQILSERYDEQTSTFNKDHRYEFTYDGELLRKIESKQWDAGSSSWFPDPHPVFGRQYRFYYEPLGDNGTAVEEIGSHVAFQIYPNPASKTVSLSAGQSQIESVEIVNAIGQVVYKTKAPISASKVTLPVGHLANGYYLVRVANGQQTHTKQLIVQH